MVARQDETLSPICIIRDTNDSDVVSTFQFVIAIFEHEPKYLSVGAEHSTDLFGRPEQWHRLRPVEIIENVVHKVQIVVENQKGRVTHDRSDLPAERCGGIVPVTRGVIELNEPGGHRHDHHHNAGENGADSVPVGGVDDPNAADADDQRHERRPGIPREVEAPCYEPWPDKQRRHGGQGQQHGRDPKQAIFR